MLGNIKSICKYSWHFSVLSSDESTLSNYGWSWEIQFDRNTYSTKANDTLISL